MLFRTDHDGRYYDEYESANGGGEGKTVFYRGSNSSRSSTTLRPHLAKWQWLSCTVYGHTMDHRVGVRVWFDEIQLSMDI
jgi:hypothetical protein